MRVASWIVTSHLRPALLRETLSHLYLHRDQVPSGWQVEIVVAVLATDPASAGVAAVLADRYVLTTAPHPSGKRNAALAACTGELVMTTDDDDFQSPRRASLAIEAYAAGHKLSGIREFRRVHLASGMVTRVCGRGSVAHARPDFPEMPPVVCGTARNYARTLLERHRGWKAEMPSLEDHDLHRRITKRRGAEAGIVEHDMGDALAADTIVLQHGANIFDRPEVRRGKVVVHGDYILVGEGHYTEIVDFPPAVAASLGTL